MLSRQLVISRMIDHRFRIPAIQCLLLASFSYKMCAGADSVSPPLSSALNISSVRNDHVNGIYIRSENNGGPRFSRISAPMYTLFQNSKHQTWSITSSAVDAEKGQGEFVSTLPSTTPTNLSWRCVRSATLFNKNHVTQTVCNG